MRTASEIARLVRSLRDGDREVRASALIRLAELRVGVRSAPIVPLLADPDEAVRAAAAFALGKLRDPGVVVDLLAAWRATRRSQRNLRRQLLIALGDAGGARAIEPVLDSFGQLSPELREVALDFIDSEPQPARRARLLRLLDSELPRTARTRIEAMLVPLAVARGAREDIVGRYPSGAKRQSEYWRRGERVAEVLWEEDGNPCWAWGLRDGKKHGPEVEWWDNGQISFVQPWVDGVLHGVVSHHDEKGNLLLETRYVRGTGVDLWCDRHSRTLSEETRLEGGHLRERRWWNPDERTVWMEEQWADEGEHGIFREWNGRGRLRRGFPRFFVRGQRVDRRTYLRRARLDRTLPPYRPGDDDPRRELPAEYVGQPVQRQNAMLVKVRERAEKVRPGMARSDVERVFRAHDGGLQAVHLTRYYEEPGIKIAIAYDETGGRWSESNRVVGKPTIYLEPSFTD